MPRSPRSIIQADVSIKLKVLSLVLLPIFYPMIYLMELGDRDPIAQLVAYAIKGDAGKALGSFVSFISTQALMAVSIMVVDLPDLNKWILLLVVAHPGTDFSFGILSWLAFSILSIASFWHLLETIKAANHRIVMRIICALGVACIVIFLVLSCVFEIIGSGFGLVGISLGLHITLGTIYLEQEMSELSANGLPIHCNAAQKAAEIESSNTSVEKTGIEADLADAGEVV